MAALEKDIEIELAKYLLEKVDGVKYPFTYTYKEAALELCFDLRLPLLSALLYKNTGGRSRVRGRPFIRWPANIGRSIGI